MNKLNSTQSDAKAPQTNADMLKSGGKLPQLGGKLPRSGFKLPQLGLKRPKAIAEIAQNDAEIAQNNAEIAQNDAEIAQNDAEIAQNDAEIAQNDAEIAQNDAEIAQNGAEIAQNDAEIVQNDAEIAQNDAEIVQNGAETPRVDAKPNGVDLTKDGAEQTSADLTKDGAEQKPETEKKDDEAAAQSSDEEAEDAASEADTAHSTVHSTDALQIGDILDDRYELLEIVGRGGCGVVYRASDLNLGRDVAVKVLSSEGTANSEMLERFEREGQILRRLHAPNTVFFYDIGTTPQDLPYIVMEFVVGRQLKTRLQEAGKLSPAETVGILSQVLQALSEAHAFGFIHRDLKPGNIMLCERYGFPGDFVKVLDFGIARIMSEDDQDSKGEMAGTPKYMAPEQFKDEPATPSTDLYSIGCIAYEMLSGTAPFDGETLHVTIAKQLFMTPQSLPSELDAYPNLEAIVFKLLEKKPQDRFASALDVIAALEHWQDSECMPSLADVRTHGGDDDENDFLSGFDETSPEAPSKAYEAALHGVALKGVYAIAETPDETISPLHLAAEQRREQVKRSIYYLQKIEQKRRSVRNLILIITGVVFLGVILFVALNLTPYEPPTQETPSASNDIQSEVTAQSESSQAQIDLYADLLSDSAVQSLVFSIVGGLTAPSGVKTAPEGEAQLEDDPPKAEKKRSRRRRNRTPLPTGKFSFQLAYTPENAHVNLVNAYGKCVSGSCWIQVTSEDKNAKIIITAKGYNSKTTIVDERVKSLKIDLKKTGD